MVDFRSALAKLRARREGQSDPILEPPREHIRSTATIPEVEPVAMTLTKADSAIGQCAPELSEADFVPELAPPSAEQQAVIDRILHTHTGNIVLTGKAGTGKSHVIKHLMASGRVAICATTGRAALNIGGCTIDKMFAISRTTWTVFSASYLDRIMSALEVDKIVIDEASMVGARMAELIGKIATQYRKQLILVGDWAQASPVKDDWGVATPLFRAATFLKLTQCHRQTDGPYLRALDQLRLGVVDDQVREVFRPRIVERPPSDDSFIRLFATNRRTDDYNQARLQQSGTSTIVTLQSTFRDARDVFTARTGKPFDGDFIARVLADSRLAHDEQFRIGARVVLTVNQAHGSEWVNGDTGIIEDIVLFNGASLAGQHHDPWKPTTASDQIADVVVRLDRGDRIVRVGRTEQEAKDPFGQPQYAVRGFPLRLGWAITIHRAQGMTVDRAFLDMSTIKDMRGESKHGLAYVALSRTRTLAGLQVANWSDDAVFCAEIVKPFI